MPSSDGVVARGFPVGAGPARRGCL